MAEERDRVELGMALGADSNMKEDSVTAKKRVKPWAITADASMQREKGTLDQDEDEDVLCDRMPMSAAYMAMDRSTIQTSAPSTHGRIAAAQVLVPGTKKVGMPISADGAMAGKYYCTAASRHGRFAAAQLLMPGTKQVVMPISADGAMARKYQSSAPSTHGRIAAAPVWVPETKGRGWEELGADSNIADRKEPIHTHLSSILSDVGMATKKLTIDPTIRSAPSTHGLDAPAQERLESFIRLAFLVYREIEENEKMLHQGSGSAPPTQGVDAPADEDEDVAHERFMDRRMFMQATQGHVDEFIRFLHSISSEKELQLSEILSQVSPQNNTCLHIAVRFGHHELAEHIVGLCPDLIKKTNSKGDTALHIAARKKDLSFVKFAMNSCPSGSGASRDVETAEHPLLRIGNKEGNTVLHEALINRCKQEEVVEILIKADPQVAYYPNKEGKSPLYLAAEAHYFHVVEAIGKPKVEEHMNINRDREAKPAVHGAILGKNKEMLEKILALKLVHQKDEHGRTPLHYAASIGYLEGVQTLLDPSNVFDRYQRDDEGFLPIHVASMRGYVDIVKELLQVFPDSIEFLSKHGENILHVAAKYGKDNVVNFVLKKKGLENLINEKDKGGNTPLHLATMHAHPKVVNYLTWDKRVVLNLVNNKDQTAFEIATRVKLPPSYHQGLVWIALKSAGAQLAPKSEAPPSGSAGAHPLPKSRVPPSGLPEPSNPSNPEFQDMTNSLLLVSTLVATVTFAAGFTMPGGYNNSDPNAGMATLLMRNMFHVFVICNTIAMYSSVLAAITLIWSKLDDIFLFVIATDWGYLFLGLAVIAMSLAFMASVYLVVSNLHWLAVVVLIIGIICLVFLLILLLLLVFPTRSTNRILRYISYYPFLILVWVSRPKI